MVWETLRDSQVGQDSGLLLPSFHRQYTTFLVRLAFESANTATVGRNLTQLAKTPKIRIGSASPVDRRQNRIHASKRISIPELASALDSRRR